MPSTAFICPDCARWSLHIVTIQKHCQETGHRRPHNVPPPVVPEWARNTFIPTYLPPVNPPPVVRTSATSIFLHGCGDCDNVFRSGAALRRHFRKEGHHLSDDPGPWTCEPCSEAFSSQVEYLEHVDSRWHGKPIPCSIPGCQRRYNTSAGLKKHLDTHVHRDAANPPPFAPRKRWTCEPCDKTYFSESEYLKHINPRWHGKPIGCEVPGCERRFKAPSGYANHLESGHHAMNRHQVAQAVHLLQVVPPITIDTPTEFMARHGIEFIPDTEFEATEVDEERIASDPISFLPGPPLGPREEEASAVAAVEPSSTAAVSASSLGELQRYGPLPLGQSLLASPSFQVYVPDDFIHLDVPYACPLCTKTFRNIASLTAHMNSPVHDPDAFMCPGCKKRFAMVSSLIQHLESGTCKLASTKEIFDNFSNLTSRFSALLIASS